MDDDDDDLYENIFSSFMGEENVSPKKKSPKKVDSGGLNDELEYLKAENDRLQRNITNLLATAQNEVARKGVQCDEFRKKYDDLLFGRAKLRLTPDSLLRVISRINACKEFKAVSVQTEADNGPPEDLISCKHFGLQNIERRPSRFSKGALPIKSLKKKAVSYCDDGNRLQHYLSHRKSLIVEKVPMKSHKRKSDCLNYPNDITVWLKVKKNDQVLGPQSKVSKHSCDSKNDASTIEVVDLCGEMSDSDNPTISKPEYPPLSIPRGHVNSASLSGHSSPFISSLEQCVEASHRFCTSMSDRIITPDLDMSCINPVVPQTNPKKFDCFVKQSTPLDRRKGIPRKLRPNSFQLSIKSNGQLVQEQGKPNQKIENSKKRDGQIISDHKDDCSKCSSGSVSNGYDWDKVNALMVDLFGGDDLAIERQLPFCCSQENSCMENSSGKLSVDNEANHQEKLSEVTSYTERPTRMYTDPVKVINVEDLQLQSINKGKENLMAKDNGLPFIGGDVIVALKNPQPDVLSKRESTDRLSERIVNHSANEVVASTVNSEDCTISSALQDVVKFTVMKKRKGKMRRGEYDLLRISPERGDLPPDNFSGNKELMHAFSFKCLDHCLKLPAIDIFPAVNKDVLETAKRKPRSEKTNNPMNATECVVAKALQNSNICTQNKTCKTVGKVTKQVPSVQDSARESSKVARDRKLRQNRKVTQETVSIENEITGKVVDVSNCDSNVCDLPPNILKDFNSDPAPTTVVGPQISLETLSGKDNEGSKSAIVSPQSDSMSKCDKSKSRVIILPRCRANKQRKLQDSNSKDHYEIRIHYKGDSKQAV